MNQPSSSALALAAAKQMYLEHDIQNMTRCVVAAYGSASLYGDSVIDIVDFIRLVLNNGPDPSDDWEFRGFLCELRKAVSSSLLCGEHQQADLTRMIAQAEVEIMLNQISS